ncbi:hypothetical protein ON010_g7312 [Phytophthora cinnamomi]|nr:hypothetical protein ON010_g7312 [Phytophthora cinnamomi]
MRRTGHTAAALQSRLRVLMRTWGNDISRFPPSFFAQVQRPRGRHPAVARQLRAHAAQHYHATLSQQVSGATLQSGRTPGPQTEQGDAIPRTQATPAAEASTESTVSASVAAAARCAVTEFRDDTATPDNENAADDSLILSPVKASPPLSPSTVEQAVAAIFSEIPRDVILRDQKKPPRNAGEAMPDGVSALLNELGPIDEGDTFDRNMYILTEAHVEQHTDVRRLRCISPFPSTYDALASFAIHVGNNCFDDTAEHRRCGLPVRFDSSFLRAIHTVLDGNVCSDTPSPAPVSEKNIFR